MFENYFWNSSLIPEDLYYFMTIKKDCNLPKRCLIYLLYKLKLKVLEKFIKDKLELEQFEPIKSSVISPVLLVPKALGDLRVYVDYRK